MDNNIPPTINSFVIRFIYDGAPPPSDSPPAAPYRGSIRHVQSDQEITFTHWADVVEFVQRFVPGIVDETQPPPIHPPKPA